MLQSDFLRSMYTAYSGYNYCWGLFWVSRTGRDHGLGRSMGWVGLVPKVLEWRGLGWVSAAHRFVCWIGVYAPLIHSIEWLWRYRILLLTYYPPLTHGTQHSASFAVKKVIVRVCWWFGFCWVGLGSKIQFQFQSISLIELEHHGRNSCTDRCPQRQ